MVKVIVVVREFFNPKPDYFLEFDLPEIPKVGDYISIFRPNNPNHSEDLIVRHVWWHLYHPETRGFAPGKQMVGNVQDVMVECDAALGPYASENWRFTVGGAESQGASIDRFDVERLSAPEKTHED